MGRRWQGKGVAVFDALIDPLQLVIVLLVIAIVMAAARWSARLAPDRATTAQSEEIETEDRPTTGGE
jgi:hypothetical protein